jgi:hypothetical protein
LESTGSPFLNRASEINAIATSKKARASEENKITAGPVDFDPFELEGFRPSSMNQEKKGLIERPTGSKYLGNTDSLSAALQIQNLPFDQNCALWITRVHQDVGLAEFLATIRTGAVFAISLKEPEGGYSTKAAKLVFMKHDAAAEFLRQVQTVGVFLRGIRIDGKWNRNGYRENWAKKSRILHIRGPAPIMTFENWNDYFHKCVCFELEAFRELPETDYTKKKMEFRFARVDGQAEAIFQAITKNPRMERVDVKYGPDPCDPASGFQ